MTHTPEATLADIMGTLDELAAAARAEDEQRYRRALTVAQDQSITDEQITDAHQWGRKGLGPAPFTSNSRAKGSSA